LGATAGFGISAIGLDLADPLAEAKTWFAGFTVFAIACFAVVVLSIVALATRQGRVAAGIAIAVALLVAPKATLTGANAGFAALSDRESEAAEVEDLADLLDGQSITINPILRRIISE
jgi:hypothetical protein